MICFELRTKNARSIILKKLTFSVVRYFFISAKFILDFLLSGRQEQALSPGQETNSSEALPPLPLVTLGAKHTSLARIDPYKNITLGRGKELLASHEHLFPKRFKHMCSKICVF